MTGLAQVIFFPGTAVLGASGVVFAMILMASGTSREEGKIPVTFILVALMYIGQQIWQGVTQRDSISQMSHIIGGITGSVLGFTLKNIHDKKS